MELLRITKTIGKCVLPQPAIEAILRRREKRALGEVPALEFDPTSLLARSAFDARVIFAAKSSLDDDWEADHGGIAAATTAGQIGSAVSTGDRRALYRLVRHFRPRSVLEFGTHLGMSTYYLAQALARNGAGRVTTVDILDVNGPDGAWRNAALKGPPSAITAELDLEGQIDFVVEPSASFMNRHREKHDLIFLDGDHSASAVYREISWALGRLNPGGLIILHDYFPNRIRLFPKLQVVQGPYLAIERLNSETSEFCVIPFSPLPWMTLPGSNNSSLAALVRS